jgi:hypothetical protein
MPRPRLAPIPSSTTKTEQLSVIFTRHSLRELGPAVSQFNTTRLTPVDRQMAKTTPSALAVGRGDRVSRVERARSHCRRSVRPMSSRLDLFYNVRQHS